MKLCTFSHEGTVHFGFELDSDRVCALPQAGRALLGNGALQGSHAQLLNEKDLKGWLSHGAKALETAVLVRQKALETPTVAGIYRRQETRILAPLPNPGKVIAVGLNYMDHAKEQGGPVPEKPLLFAKFPTAITGPDEPIKLPPMSRKVDPEAELCVVMLERGRRFTAERAKQAAGFMVGNDVSARDIQFADKQWVRSKSFDTFAPCGPYVVTGEDVGDPHSLDIELKLNDRVQQSSNTRNLIFDCYDLIQFISEAITLEVGDIIFTGTPSGVGFFRDPPVFLKAGDVVEVSIQNLGTLKNPVIADS